MSVIPLSVKISSTTRGAPLTTRVASYHRTKETSAQIQYNGGITGSYADDYDIIGIDRIVRAKLIQEIAECADIEHRIFMETSRIELCKNFVEYQMSLTEIKKLETSFKEVKSGGRSTSYVKESSHILEKYKKLRTRTRKISFSDGTAREEIIDPDRDERLDMITSYLNIAKKYIKIDVVREKKDEKKCMGCGTPLIKSIIIDDEEGTVRCTICNVQYFFNPLGPGVESMIRTDKGDRANFEKAINCYQGKVSKKMSASLFADLDRYFRRMGKPIGDEVRLLPLQENGHRGSTEVSSMISALKETGHSSYYDYVYSIARDYWGWILPDVSHLFDVLMSDYDVTQKIFEKIKGTRSSSMSKYVRLYFHLIARGHKCSIKDFKLVKTEESARFHNWVIKEMFRGSGIKELVDAAATFR